MTYGMLIDLKKCVGCHACSVACKEAHGTRPGVRRSRVDRVFEGTYPDVRKTAYPMLCMHCETAPCVEVCPQDATYKREDGIVAVSYTHLDVYKRQSKGRVYAFVCWNEKGFGAPLGIGVLQQGAHGVPASNF